MKRLWAKESVIVCVCVTVVIKNRIMDLIYSQDEKIGIKYFKIITLIGNVVL